MKRSDAINELIKLLEFKKCKNIDSRDCSFIYKIYEDFENEMKSIRESAREELFSTEYGKEIFEAIFGYSYDNDEVIGI